MAGDYPFFMVAFPELMIYPLAKTIFEMDLLRDMTKKTSFTKKFTYPRHKTL